MLDPAADTYLFVNNGASDEDLELELTYFDDGLNNTDLDSFGLTPHSTGDIYFLLYRYKISVVLKKLFLHIRSVNLMSKHFHLKIFILICEIYTAKNLVILGRLI